MFACISKQEFRCIWLQWFILSREMQIGKTGGAYPSGDDDVLVSRALQVHQGNPNLAVDSLIVLLKQLAKHDPKFLEYPKPLKSLEERGGFCVET